MMHACLKGFLPVNPTNSVITRQAHLAIWFVSPLVSALGALVVL